MSEQDEIAQLKGEVGRLNQRIAELERRLKIPFGKLPCALCGGPHDFDTPVPSVVWNSVTRAKNLPDYLCTTCIVREFVREGQSFTAELWNEEFNGVPIEVVVNGQNAKDAAAVQEENNSLRNQISTARASAIGEATEALSKAAHPMINTSSSGSADYVMGFANGALEGARQVGESVDAALESLIQQGEGGRGGGK